MNEENDELVVFISHIFNDFYLTRYEELKRNLLTNQNIVWAYNTDIDQSIADHDINSFKVNLSKNYLMGPNNTKFFPNFQKILKISRNFPNNDEYFLALYDKYPNYKNYWFIENDVSVNTKDKDNSFRCLFEFYKDDTADLISGEIYSYAFFPLNALYPYRWVQPAGIEKKDIRLSFLPICRISNRLMKISKEDDRFSKLFFEFKYATICHICHLNAKMIDHKFLNPYPFKCNPTTIKGIDRKINNKSVSWDSKNFIKYNITSNTKIFEYNSMTLLHPIKSDNIATGLEKFEQYNENDNKLKVWLCGNNYELDPSLDRLVYNKFDLSLPYKRYNINDYNRFFSEYVCWFYVWTNDIKSDYICTGHYSRIPRQKYIDINILDEGKIQYFCQVRRHLAGHKFKYPEYAFIENQVNEFGGPMFLLDDIIEWLEQQTNIDHDKIKEYTHAQNNIKFANREIFACKWDIFCNMMEFLQSYLDFINDKYNLHSVEDWKRHISEKVISWYKANAEGYKEDFCKCAYQTPENFNHIYNDDEGFSGYCNCWRVYSYMIEILISIYIKTHDNTFNVNTWLSIMTT